MPERTGQEPVGGARRVAIHAAPLAVLTASGLRWEWYEATAVVLEVCALVADSGAVAARLLPDQQHVLITPDGRVALSSHTPATAASQQDQVTALARLLLSLVAEDEMPVQLRLVALSAVSPTPAFSTIESLSRAVGYFERPGRLGILTSLAHRWDPQSRAPGQPPPAVPAAPPAAPRERPTRWGPTAPRVRLVVGIAIVTAAVGVAALALRGRVAGSTVASGTHAVTRLWSQVWQTTQQVAVSLASAVRATFDRASGQPAATLPDQANRGGAGAAGPPRRGGSGSSAPAGAAVPGEPGSPPHAAYPQPVDQPALQAFDLGLTKSGQPTSGMAATPPESRPLRAESGRYAGDANARPGGAPSPVYSAADPDVEPPAPIRPKIATVLPETEREENLTVVDLVISVDGSVESVRLVRPARGAREVMMLSAVKAWQFRPALKDGQPVRYSKRIWISLLPLGTTVR